MVYIQAKNLLVSNKKKASYFRQNLRFFSQQFQVYYQPIVSLRDNRISSFEALLRCRQGDSLLSPAEFMPLVEKTGLIIPLGYWMIEEIYLQMKDWLQRFPSKTPTVSVNLSATQLEHPNLLEHIEEVFRREQLDGQNLQVEIPERVLRKDVKSKVGILSDLKAFGVRILVDDVDPLHSFSEVLGPLPVDAVKLWRVLPCHLEAHNLGVEVIVKGIERTRQLEIIQDLGCHYGQGFLFSKAVTSQEATKLIAAQPASSHEHCRVSGKLTADVD